MKAYLQKDGYFDEIKKIFSSNQNIASSIPGKYLETARQNESINKDISLIKAKGIKSFYQAKELNSEIMDAITKYLQSLSAERKGFLAH